MVVLCACRPAPPPPAAAPEARVEDEALAYYLSGQMAAAAGDAVEAARSADWMLRLAEDPHTLVHAAELYLLAGREAEAVGTASRAIEADPSLPEAWRIGGLASLAAGDADAALERLDRARGLPGVEAARLRLLVERGDPSAAAVLEAFVPATPGEGLANARLWGWMGRHRDALVVALSVADDALVGAEALGFALEEGRAACDLGPVADWVRAHPSVGVRPKLDAELLEVARAVAADPLAPDLLDAASCGADTVTP